MLVRMYTQFGRQRSQAGLEIRHTHEKFNKKYYICMCVCVYEYIRGKEIMWYIVTIRKKKSNSEMQGTQWQWKKEKLNLILKNV